WSSDVCSSDLIHMDISLVVNNDAHTSLCPVIDAPYECMVLRICQYHPWRIVSSSIIHLSCKYLLQSCQVSYKDPFRHLERPTEHHALAVLKGMEHKT